MPASSSDRIQKQVRLSAPLSRVWRALSDFEEFGLWFGVRLEGPIRAGETIRGRITTPGYEHLKLVAHVESVEPEHRLALRWCPFAMDPDVDSSDEPTTLVEWVLEEVDDGVLLTVTESGFDGIPEKYRSESFLRNEQGWTLQMESIRRHVDG
jgi:uncharacterized protein YndB with AHSA1/START domain